MPTSVRVAPTVDPITGGKPRSKILNMPDVLLEVQRRGVRRGVNRPDDVRLSPVPVTLPRRRKVEDPGPFNLTQSESFGKAAGQPHADTNRSRHLMIMADRPLSYAILSGPDLWDHLKRDQLRLRFRGRIAQIIDLAGGT